MKHADLSRNYSAISDLLDFPMTHAHRLLLGGLVGSLACLPGCLKNYGNETETDTSGDGSTEGSSSTTDDTTSTTDPDPTTTSSEAACGNGQVEDGEDCDNGPDNADDATCTAACKMNTCGDGLVLAGVEDCDAGEDNADEGACTTQCKSAGCGDGHVQMGVEACDDGTNDGSYGGCAPGCASLAPRCGDDNVDARMEECDGGEGCLATCQYARSCVDYKEADPAAESATYFVLREGVADPVEVWCDMETDGGGYTFLKVDIDSELNDFPYPANKAEMKCEEYGMQLFIPRTEAHLLSAYTVATTITVYPVGGGTVESGVDYLRILGIYPAVAGESCVDQPLNSADCPQWLANDEKAWWVSAAPVTVGEPDPDGACDGCSMSYQWNADGTVKKYLSLPDTGGTSFRFMCDIGDKAP